MTQKHRGRILPCSNTSSFPCVCSPHWSSTSPRTQRGIAASLCSAHELYYAEPPSNRSSVERNFMQICVSARPPAKLVAPPAMRHHAKTSATAITDLRFAVLSHDTLALRVDTNSQSSFVGTDNQRSQLARFSSSRANSIRHAATQNSRDLAARSRQIFA